MERYATATLSRQWPPLRANFAFIGNTNELTRLAFGDFRRNAPLAEFFNETVNF